MERVASHDVRVSSTFEQSTVGYSPPGAEKVKERDFVNNDALDETRCSFCEKPVERVRKLIQGPGSVSICDECVEVCNDILADFFDRPSSSDEQQENDEPGLVSFTCPACGHEGRMKSRA